MSSDTKKWDKIVKMFQKCDINHSGFIEREDLIHNFPDLSMQDINDIYDHIDKNKDGLISLAEFAVAYKEREDILGVQTAYKETVDPNVDQTLIHNTKTKVKKNNKISNGTEYSKRFSMVNPEHYSPNIKTKSSSLIDTSIFPFSDRLEALRNKTNRFRIPTLDKSLKINNLHNRDCNGEYYNSEILTTSDKDTFITKDSKESPRSFTSSYKKSKFRNMKPNRMKANKDIIESDNISDKLNVTPSSSTEDTSLMEEQEKTHKQRSARRPSLQAGNDPNQIDELRTIEDQKKFFMDTLSEIPCESEIYRLYEIVSNPELFTNDPSQAINSDTSHSADNLRSRSNSILSLPSINSEAKHLFEEIFYNILTDYRKKKQELNKFTTLYNEKMKECEKLKDIIDVNSNPSHDMKHKKNPRARDHNDKDCNLQLIRNRFTMSGLEPKCSEIISYLRPQHLLIQKEFYSDSNLYKKLEHEYKIGGKNPEKSDTKSYIRNHQETQTPNGEIGNLSLSMCSPLNEASLDTASDRIFNVILAGDASVGKTSILIQFCENRYEPDLQSTLGIDCMTKSVMFEKLKVTLKIWDTVGQERFRSLTQSYFRRADGIILVYDSSNESSLINIRYWLTSIKESANKKDVSIVICSNKCDISPSNQSIYTLNSLAVDIANVILMWK
ncbi:unnamed protein product [Gordionus sp. m RMFG-2023]